MTTATGTFCWHELATRDAERSRAFYTELFGWTYQEMPMGPMGTYTVFMKGDGPVCGMYQMQGPQLQGVPPHWMSYLAIDDIDANQARAKELGATILVPPTDVPEMGRMCVFQDPTGAAIATWKAAKADDAAATRGVGKFCWDELMTSDVAKAVDFYSKLYGWTSKTETMGGMEYTTFNLGELQVAGCMAITETMGPVPPHWLGYIEVADCRGSVTQATDRKATVLCQPKDIGIGTFAVFQGPDEAVVAVFQGKQ